MRYKALKGLVVLDGQRVLVVLDCPVLSNMIFSQRAMLFSDFVQGGSIKAPRRLSLLKPILGTTLEAILGILGLILGILGGAQSALDYKKGYLAPWARDFAPAIW